MFRAGDKIRYMGRCGSVVVNFGDSCLIQVGLKMTEVPNSDLVAGWD